jgi:hypothetical protein
VTDKTWVFDASSGQLIVKTGVTGRVTDGPPADNRDELVAGHGLVGG